MALRQVLGAPASALRGSTQSVLLTEHPRWATVDTGGADLVHQSHEAYGVTCRDAQTEFLVPLFIDLWVDGARVQDCLLWNMYEGTTTVDDVARTFCRDNGLSAPLGSVIAASLRRQIATHAACAGLPDLIDVQVRGGAASVPGAVFDAETKGREVVGEQLHTIRLAIHYGGRLYSDRFEWDVANPDNDPCEFARITCADLGFPVDWEPIIAACVLEQVRRFQYAAARVPNQQLIPQNVVAAATSSTLPTVTPETSVRPPAIAKLYEPDASAVSEKSALPVRSFTFVPPNPMDPRPLTNLHKGKAPEPIKTMMADKTASFEPFRQPYSVVERLPPHHRAKDSRPRPTLGHPFSYTEKPGPLRGVDYPA